MAEKSSLLGVRVRIETQRAKAALGLQSKFNGGGLSGLLRPAVGGGGDFGPTPLSSPKIPGLPRGFPTLSPGTFPSGASPLTQSSLSGLAGAGCELLTGVARDVCLAGLRFLQPQTDPGGGTCPTGTIRIGENCVSPGDLFPGGAPLIQPVTQGGGVGPGVATVGAFGLPALAPSGVSRLVRKCNRGMVLGIDNLCYPKAVLTGRSKFRKWRRPVRPPVTRRDVVAIRRSAAARDRVLELAKDVGLSVSKTKTRRKAKKAGHGHGHHH